MKFNRVELLKAVDQALADRQKVIDANQAKRDEAGIRAHREWIETYGPAWTEAAKRIAAKIRRNHVVTQADLPTRLGASHATAVYSNTRHLDEDAVPNEYPLRGLRAALTAVADDTITSSALRDLGVGAETMRKLVPLMGAASVLAGRAKAVK